jgi:2-methylisocitrate lyase-like PEP mutase family enzyme
MIPTQNEKAERFRTLHAGPKTFVIPNPWDAGTARMLTALGFPALATTSAGFAFSVGRRDGDGAVTRDETLAHARAIVEATDRPVSADLENGFGADPATVAETIRMAASVGLVGGFVEDATTDPRRPLYAFGHAVERVAAAIAAARALPFPFTLVARAENFLRGKPDLGDTIRRLQAYAAAGADVLYAPALPHLDAVRAVCAAVHPLPVNVLAGGKGSSSRLRTSPQRGSGASASARR